MRKREAVYDDQTLENMKRYYKIDSYDELLKFIKRNGLVGDSEGADSSYTTVEEIQ
jgi:hypothetical protein